LKHKDRPRRAEVVGNSIPQWGAPEVRLTARQISASPITVNHFLPGSSMSTTHFVSGNHGCDLPLEPAGVVVELVDKAIMPGRLGVELDDRLPRNTAPDGDDPRKARVLD
jgi:hypothetical protein